MDGKAPLLIDGEYDMVTRASADVAALRLAHQTPVTRDEAQRMITDLCARLDVSLQVRFTARHGLCSMRAAYRFKLRTYQDGTPVLNARGQQKRRREYIRDAEGRHLWQLSISLPTKVGAPTPTGGWGLRAGLVLHEFAHAVVQARGLSMRAVGHGPLFTWLLDALVADWRK